MWIDPNIHSVIDSSSKIIKDSEPLNDDKFHVYDEDDTTTTTTTTNNYNNSSNNERTLAIEDEDEEESLCSFEAIMNDPENTRISKYQNTYFMDGGNRFISLPTLGNTSTKAASHISRMFEDWLQQKLCYQTYDERLPILEDSVELLAEDIVNKLKSRNSIRGLTGLSRILIKIRTGHVYTYHSLKDGQPLITADMEGFFQQFPLFVEIIIYTMPRQDMQLDDVKLLLSVENITLNSSDPYLIRQDIQLVA
ncbi:hypothetical protein G6F46_000524 [Rhizopus delemar]|uniref:Uncharacterized protein n=3 Tax=Rhizopus TaxID=4842 RepID=I1BYX7_RHIO9|nr:hypothetical protein RO3G_06112 [Rhizopus delemar RA 99-880]KAG1466882.1 hypothetical protein G6F55_000206 [Rhizopus delemar]KAG1554223.1 hypothetical protein G6F51_000088 [Rhizopus arrhizus]KAG1502826.1 hypothetical protein G6F54_002098 [Rhizopus delemar]KAG1518859.1 hypothetical protein G6F53_000234 [Rhizopus delemar]|eukprot:EIE81407.1 hypothetical protein RO3G_06112 [Rhizopus delemar RA 99-880]